jgi:methionine-rich copper-binding protein CopC
MSMTCLAARGRASWLRRLGLAAVIALFLGTLLPTSADAHAVLVSSNPEDGSSIDVLPDAVSFTFDENVATPAFIAVTAPDGTNVADGDPTVLDATVTQPVRPVGEKGSYSMSYRVVSADGHPITATLTFDVTTGDEVESPVAQPSSSSGHSGHDGAGEGSFFSSHKIEAVVAVVVVVLGLALLIGSSTSARGREDRS